MDEQLFVNLIEKYVLIFKLQGISDENDLYFKLTKTLEESPLRPVVEIKPSDIHGNGVFAKEDIENGKVVAVYPCHAMLSGGTVLSAQQDSERYEEYYEEYYCKLPNNKVIFGFPDVCKGCLLAHIINDSSVGIDRLKQTDELGDKLVDYVLNCTGNCCIKYFDNVVYVVTTKLVDKDQELVCSYGYEFWFGKFNTPQLMDYVQNLRQEQKDQLLTVINNISLAPPPTVDYEEFDAILDKNKAEYNLLRESGKKDSVNIKRHRDSESLYAHFSLVDSFNYLLFPNLLFTNPVYITLSAGQCLYIPKKWWHWVKTTEKTFAVNYWFNDNENDTSPFVFSYNQKINLNTIRETVYVWDSLLDKDDKPVSFKQFYNSGLDNLYVITLNNYNNNNEGLKRSLQNFITFPTTTRITPPDLFEYNIWASSGKHDTGLHYDDEDGILSVVEGTKDIILFPPSDTPYLYKLEVSYKWIKETALNFHYNSYQFIENTSGISSSKLLYETCRHDIKVLANISKLYSEYREVSDYVIWGFKKDGSGSSDCRWELYSYFPKNIDDKEICIFSRDIYPETYNISPEIHLYYNLNPDVGLPFWGCGKFINPLTKQLYDETEIFVVDSTSSFYLNYTDHMTRLGYKDIMDSIKELVFKYKCYETSVHNKNRDHIFIQYLGISNSDFVGFLKDNDYALNIIDLVNDDYNINNEITIVYNLKTKEIVRSAIYGVLG